MTLFLANMPMPNDGNQKKNPYKIEISFCSYSTKKCVKKKSAQKQPSNLHVYSTKKNRNTYPVLKLYSCGGKSLESIHGWVPDGHHSCPLQIIKKNRKKKKKREHENIENDGMLMGPTGHTN